MSPSPDSPLQAHTASPAELRDRLHAERDGDPFLVFRDGSGTQRIHGLKGDAARVTVGRSPGNDLALTWDTEASRVHAELERLGDEWTICDDGLSTNGSFLNGERISGRQRLRDGAVVRIGQTTLAFRVPDPMDSRPTVIAAGTPALALSDVQRRILIALCRPLLGEVGVPATNAQVAAEVFLSVDAVKANLRALFAAFGIEDLPQNQKRSVLAMRALRDGLISARDL